MQIKIDLELDQIIENIIMQEKIVDLMIENINKKHQLINKKPTISLDDIFGKPDNKIITVVKVLLRMSNNKIQPVGRMRWPTLLMKTRSLCVQVSRAGTATSKFKIIK